MSNLAKLVFKHLKAKFEPNLVYIIKLVNSQNRTKFTKFIDFIDFARVKSDCTCFEILVRFCTLDTCWLVKSYDFTS
jgi:hypothetical protein